MKDLLGIIVVAQFGLGGDQLIFRYPPVVRNRVTAETMQDFHDKHPNHPSKNVVVSSQTVTVGKKL